MRRAAAHDGWICAYRNVDQATADLGAIRALREAHPARSAPFATAAVGPMRRPETLRRLADEGYDAAIVPIAMLARGRERADWMQAVAAAARLAGDAGIGLRV
jgi:hypothetical protein